MSCVALLSLCTGCCCDNWKVAWALRVHVWQHACHIAGAQEVWVPVPSPSQHGDQPSARDIWGLEGAGSFYEQRATAWHSVYTEFASSCIKSRFEKMQLAIASPRLETQRQCVFETPSPHSPALCQESSRIKWHIPSPSRHLKSIVINVYLYRYNFQNNIVEF